MAEDHGQRAKHRKRHRGEEQDAMLEFAVKIRRQRHGGCDRQQIDGGDPLHSSSVHVEFPHELWEQHRHHGFGEDADEGERADRHDGADEFAGNAFVRRFLRPCATPRLTHGPCKASRRQPQRRILAEPLTQCLQEMNIRRCAGRNGRHRYRPLRAESSESAPISA